MALVQSLTHVYQRIQVESMNVRARNGVGLCQIKIQVDANKTRLRHQEMKFTQTPSYPSTMRNV